MVFKGMRFDEISQEVNVYREEVQGLVLGFSNIRGQEV